MNLVVYDALVASPELGTELAELKEFRRSTRSILKGAALIKELFQRNPALKAMAESKRVAFVVGTSVGEIDVTRDFLKELVVNQTARPFLFQLSSHNSTTGFLAQYFKLAGPTLTISNQYQSAEASLESANLYLESDLCDAAIVFCVDQVIDTWMDLKMYEKNPQLKEVSGACVMLVGKKNSTKEEAPFAAKALLKDFQYAQPTLKASPEGTHYDSNTLEVIAQKIQQNLSGSFEHLRPDQTMTEVVLDVYS